MEQTEADDIKLTYQLGVMPKEQAVYLLVAGGKTSPMAAYNWLRGIVPHLYQISRWTSSERKWFGALVGKYGPKDSRPSL